MAHNLNIKTFCFHSFYNTFIAAKRLYGPQIGIKWIIWGFIHILLHWIVYNNAWYIFSLWGYGMAIPHAEPRCCFSIVCWCISLLFNGSTTWQIFQDVNSVDAIGFLQTDEAPVTAVKEVHMCVSLEVLTVVNIEIVVFWAMTSCSWLLGPTFGET
jgi:hypothetical protein